jgi:hypothetical protein
MSNESVQATQADGGDAAPQTVQEMRDRMAEIKKQVSADVDSKWGSPWRTTQTFDLKVTTRLTGNAEYRALRVAIQKAEAAGASDAAGNGETN